MTNLTIFERFLESKGVSAHAIAVPEEATSIVIVDCTEAGVDFTFENGKLISVSIRN